MGLMRFTVAPPQRLTEELAQQAYLSGMDRAAWQVRVAIEQGQLVLRRAESDAARLNLPWPVEGRGRLTLSTGSLIERPEAYHLPLELARGTIGQLCNQMSDWQVVGLAVPQAVRAKAAEAIRELGQAAVSQEDAAASSRRAEVALRIGLEAGDALAGVYVEHVVSARRHAGAKPALLAAHLDETPLDDATARQFLAVFDTALVPLPWRTIEASEDEFSWSAADAQIEWCRSRGLTVCAGPLVQLDERGVPDWLYLWEEDFDSILAFASKFVRAAAERYRGKVDLWQCAARANSADILGLSEEDRLRLAARTIELVRELDPDAAALVSFDQPWAEYMSRRELDFPPWHLADALVRAGLDLSGVILEISVGYQPGGTVSRSLLEFSRLLDYWSVLGLPLLVAIIVPSDSGPDPLAQRQDVHPSDRFTPAAQQAWVARYVPLILAKPQVQGVIWTQLRDSQPHELPHGGLLDARRQAKPALRTLAAVKHAYLR